MFTHKIALQAGIVALLLTQFSFAQSDNADRPFAGTGDIGQIATLSNEKSGKIEQLDRSMVLRQDVEEKNAQQDEDLTLSDASCRLSTEQQEILDQLRLSGQSFTDECAFFAWLSEDTEAQQVQRVNEAVVAGEIQGVLSPIEAPKTPEMPEVPNTTLEEISDAIATMQTGAPDP